MFEPVLSNRREMPDWARCARGEGGPLRVRFGERELPLIRVWETGFSLETVAAAHVPGLVDLYAGRRYLARALIVDAGDWAGERRFEFKRRTLASDVAPVDFVRETPELPHRY